MQAEGWDVDAAAEAKGENADVEHLPDVENLCKVFAAQASDPMKPFSSESRGTLTTLRGALRLGFLGHAGRAGRVSWDNLGMS